MGQFERAELVRFAYEEARHTGNIDCMKAVCYVMRNRVSAGWGKGTFTEVITHHGLVKGNDGDRSIDLDIDDRLLQMMVRDVDDIYLGTSDDQTRKVVADALYYHFVDQPLRQWFVERILQEPKNHPGIATIGMMRLFR